MTDVRRQISQHVLANPGVHFNELTRQLDIATGQAQYHLRRLREGSTLETEHLRGRTHYFPTGYEPRERRTLALLRRETVREMLVYALEAGEPREADIAEELGVARSTVAWHVSTLVEAGVAEKCYDERGRVRLCLHDPDELCRLLEEISPSLPDRLVDRFTRLVDASFYG
jgi:predicted transcriptional regulator